MFVLAWEKVGTSVDLLTCCMPRTACVVVYDMKKRRDESVTGRCRPVLTSSLPEMLLSGIAF